LEAELTRHGLEKEVLGVRMTGCPNGCVRPNQSDIGIVGRSGDKYTLYAGGRVLGDRLNLELADLVPRDRIVATLGPLLARFKEQRQEGESFGDYCHRMGEKSLHQMIQNH
jgi:sulfite reductase (ferredoxin)